MERRFVKGDTLEQNIDSIDLILQSWAPRLGQYITGVIPPVPILHHTRLPDEDGTILKLLIPFSGKVTAAYISIGKYNVRPATIDVWSTSEAGYGGIRIICDRPLHAHFGDPWQVPAGCILEATVTPPNAIEDINIGVLINIDMEHTQHVRQLIDALRVMEQVQ